jgi:hypothetical protein
MFANTKAHSGIASILNFEHRPRTWVPANRGSCRDGSYLLLPFVPEPCQTSR